MTKGFKILLPLFLIATTFGCDRITKHLAMASLAGAPDRSFLSGAVQLEYAENSGGFLSIGSNLSRPALLAIFTVATGLMLIALVIIAVKCRDSVWQLAGISLALAGGVSNLVDRIMRGTVVDFMTIGVGSLRTGVFNVADVAILAGICMLLVSPGNSAQEDRDRPGV